SARFQHVLQQRENRADLPQMFGVLRLKDGCQSFVNARQSRYLSVVFRSCCPSEARSAAAFSIWRVLDAAWSLLWPISFTARITCSKPICCWLVPAIICWNACKLF